MQLVIGSTYESSRGFGRLLYLGETHGIDGYLPTFRTTKGEFKHYSYDQLPGALVEFASPTVSRADELIACLEGEIAKRDETIARLEPQLNRAIQANYDLREELAACRVAVENCEVFRARIAELEDDLKCAHSMLCEVSKSGMVLRAELAAIKAQEPVGWYTEDHLDDKSATTYSKELADRWVAKGWPVFPLYAAPVSVAKAQDTVGEVVGWYRLDRPYEMTSYPSVCATWHKLGAPVAPLYAAPAAPAADAGLVEALELAANRLDRLALEQGEFWRGYATAWADEARATANGAKS